MRRRTHFALFLLLAWPLTGCALLYELQPHRLRQWNRGPAPSIDPDFTTMKNERIPAAIAANGNDAPHIARAQQ
jgi:hypothetical protein